MYPTPAATEAGSNQNGICGDKPSAGTPTLHTFARRWQTPRASDGEKGGPNQVVHGEPALASQACRLWPTATSGDSKASGGRNETARHSERTHPGTSLTDAAVRNWPTPTARLDDPRGMPSPALARARMESGKTNLDDAVSALGHPDQTTCSHGGACRRSLNPRFVAWLMGFPLDWCEVDVTP